MTELSTSTRADGLARWAAPRESLGGISILDRLFNRMDGAYGLKWKANFPNPQTIDNWREECATAFEEERITPAQVVAGIRACRRLHPEWPPNVQQFVNACNPPVDPVAAYHEAMAGVEARNKGEVGAWSHPAIYWAAAKLGRDLMSQPGAAMRDRWAAVLKAQLARAEWEPIPAARVLLEAPGPSKLTKEEAAERLAKLGAANIIKRPGGKADHKAWARALLARHEDEKLPAEQRIDPRRAVLTLAQITAARQALGVEIQPIDDEMEGDHECITASE